MVATEWPRLEFCYFFVFLQWLLPCDRSSGSNGKHMRKDIHSHWSTWGLDNAMNYFWHIFIIWSCILIFNGKATLDIRLVAADWLNWILCEIVFATCADEKVKRGRNEHVIQKDIKTRNISLLLFKAESLPDKYIIMDQKCDCCSAHQATRVCFSCDPTGEWLSFF